jgi:hypothetical protein
VVPGGRGVGRQEEDAGQLVVEVEIERDELERGRDKDDAVEIEAVAVLEVGGEAGGAGSAVAFAREELRGEPAAVAGGRESRMKSPTDSMSFLKPWNCFAFSPSTGRL